jgi:hypothetical protein
MKTQELRSKMIRDPNRHQMYFCVKDIMKKDVFIAEEDQIIRGNLTSMVSQYRRSLAYPMALSEVSTIIGY